MPQVTWDDSRVFIAPQPLMKGIAPHVPGPHVIPRDEIATLRNRPPRLFLRGRLLLTSRQGGRFSVPYARAEADHYAALVEQVERDEISGTG